MVRPCSEVLALFSPTLPGLTRAMFSFSECSSCQLPMYGRRALQGPQLGSVKSSMTGFPEDRKEPRVSVSL